MGFTQKQLQAALAEIELLVLDVDGVWTDGGCFIGAREELKRFNSRDDTGIKYLQRNGVKVAVITGRRSESVERHCADLGIEEVHQRALKKLPVLEGMVERLGLRNDQIAVLGDDLLDLPMMRRARLGIAVADAVEDVRRHADWVTNARGGHGAVREVVEAILKAKGLWAEVVEGYLG